MFKQIRLGRNAFVAVLTILGTSVTVFAARSALHRSLTFDPSGATTLSIPTSVFELESIDQSEDSSIHFVFDVVIDDRATAAATDLLNSVHHEIHNDTIHVSPTEDAVLTARNSPVSEYFEKAAKRSLGRMTVMMPRGLSIAIQRDDGQLVSSGQISQAAQELTAQLKGRLNTPNTSRDANSAARLNAADQLRAVLDFADAQEKSAQNQRTSGGIFSVSEIGAILSAIDDREARRGAANRLGPLVLESEKPLLTLILRRCFQQN